MVDDRIKIYREFSEYMEYPMVMFSEITKKVIDINERAVTVLGENIESVVMQPDKFMYSEDFWGMLHEKRSIIWHRILLIVNGRRYVVSGLINEFQIDDETNYVVMFNLRTDMNLGNVTLERIISHAGLVAFYLYKVEGNWKVRYASRNVNRYGYTSEQFYNGDISLEDFVYPEDRAIIKNSIDVNVAMKNDDFAVDLRVLSEAEDIIMVKVTVHIVRDKYNVIEGIEIVFYDLSGEKDKELRNIYFEKALDKIRTVYIVKRYSKGDRKLVFVSTNAKLLGMNISALNQGYKLTEDYIHPEDREKVIDKIYGGIDRGVTNFNQQYRMVGDDGVCHWVNNEITVTRLSQDEAELEFLLTDITEHKRTEEKLLANQEDLKSKIDYVMRDGEDFGDEKLELLALMKDEKIVYLFDTMAEFIGICMAMVDEEGRLITTPRGPMYNLGDFYDIFEKSFYKEKYNELKNMLFQEGKDSRINVDEGNIKRVMVAAPIIISGKHVATWIMCAYSAEELDLLERVNKAHLVMSNMLSVYMYNEVVREKEAQKRRLAEIRCEQEVQLREALQDISEHSYGPDVMAFEYICEKAGRYLDIEMINIILQDETTGEFRFINSWASDDKHILKDFEIANRQDGCKKLFQLTDQRGEVIVNSQEIELEFCDSCIAISNMKAVMSFGIVMDEEIVGMVTFVESDIEREWTKREVEFARGVSGMISGVIRKREKSNVTKVAHQELLESYHLFSEVVFVKDRYSDIVLFSNKACNKLFGNDFVGSDSKEILAPGPEKLGGISKRIVANKKETSGQIYIKDLEKTMAVTELKIEWLDGRKAILVIMREIS